MIAYSQFAADRIQGSRAYQEDDFGILNRATAKDSNTDKLLLILADGMGGHQHGAKASAVAIEACMDGYENAMGNTAQRLSAALLQANLA
ncbi:MAG: hypothetical protein R8K21_07520, partial [Mariprofundales bacterium]